MKISNKRKYSPYAHFAAWHHYDFRRGSRRHCVQIHVDTWREEQEFKRITQETTNRFMHDTDLRLV